MLYLPNLPAPNSSRYFEEAVGEIRELLALTEGRAFLLFTSFRQMNRVHEVLQGDLPFPLLKQGEMPKNRLLELFKSTPNSVLCATSSFWQGVDVRGDALRAVIIDKLPFHVPTEPLVAARIHRLTEQGENPFMSYTVPDAIITLKQGLGRLIRSREDWGILAVLDSRLRTKRYGNMFLRSLPNCPLTDNMDSLRNFFSQHASPANGGS
jgi:ATP-dependent DNA helicase DinG